MNEINFDDFHKHIMHAENYLNFSRESWEKGTKVAAEAVGQDDNISVDSVHDVTKNTALQGAPVPQVIDDPESTIFFASDLPHIKPWEPYNFQESDKSISRYGDSLDTPLEKSTDADVSHLINNTAEKVAVQISAPKSPSTGKYLKSKEDLMKEAEEDFRMRHSFKPTIATASNTTVTATQHSLHLPTRSSLNKLQRRKSFELNKAPLSKVQVAAPLSHRIEELHASHRSRQEELNRQRREFELQELSKCSFTPRLSKGTQERISRQRRTDEAIDRYYQQHADDSDLPHSSLASDVSQRLHDDAESRRNQRMWLESEVRRRRDAHATYQPSINPTTPSHSVDGSTHTGNTSSSLSDRKPIHLRIYDLQQDKQKHLKELSAAIESSQTDMTFHPKIDSRSRVMAERRQVELLSTDYDLATQRYLSASSEIDVGSRLTLEGKKQARRMIDLKEESEKSLMESMMQPEVCKGTKRIAEKSPVVSANFVKRSEMIRERKERREEDRMRAEAFKYNSWFQPHIYSDARGIIAEKRPELLNESESDRYERMINEFNDVKTSHVRATEKDMYGGDTFSPSIDPISRALGRDSNIDELYENIRGKTLKEQIRLKNEALESEECSFRPHINSTSRVLSTSNAGNENVDENLRYSQVRINLNEPEKMARNIRLHLLEKEERRRSEIIARELEELKECTFQPSIAQFHPQDVNEAGPIVVKGLGRHLELKHLSRKQKDEAAQREKDAFSVKNVDKFRRAEDGSTIVQSFRFHQMHACSK